MSVGETGLIGDVLERLGQSFEVIEAGEKLHLRPKRGYSDRSRQNRSSAASFLII